MRNLLITLGFLFFVNFILNAQETVEEDPIYFKKLQGEWVNIVPGEYAQKLVIIGNSAYYISFSNGKWEKSDGIASYNNIKAYKYITRSIDNWSGKTKTTSFSHGEAYDLQKSNISYVFNIYEQNKKPALEIIRFSPATAWDYQHINDVNRNGKSLYGIEITDDGRKIYRTYYKSKKPYGYTISGKIDLSDPIYTNLKNR